MTLHAIRPFSGLIYDYLPLSRGHRERAKSATGQLKADLSRLRYAYMPASSRYLPYRNRERCRVGC